MTNTARNGGFFGEENYHIGDSARDLWMRVTSKISDFLGDDVETYTLDGIEYVRVGDFVRATRDKALVNGGGN